MNAAFTNLVAEALKLDSNERMAFVQLLLASLHNDDELDEVLAVEVARRIADIDSGVAQAIPMSEALAQVRSKFK
jgi:uncharacterized tellurite resistance protein B-like protein